MTTEPTPDATKVAAFRATLTAPVILLLPGSRKSEVTRLLPRFQETLAQLRTNHPDLTALLPIAPGVEAEVKDLITDPNIRLIDPASPDKALAFRAADVALAASGTVSLELAAAGTPMVIGYDMNRMTYGIMKRMLLTDTVTLVNLVADSRTIPEFIGPDCQSEVMAKALDTLLTDKIARAAQTEAMHLTMERLGAGGEPPGLRAARVVLEVAR